MAVWYVPVELKQSDQYPLLSNDELMLLVGSLPGGGTASSGDERQMIGPRQFMHTVELEAETRQDAEKAAPTIALGAIDGSLFPGWQVTRVGEAKQADKA